MKRHSTDKRETGAVIIEKVVVISLMGLMMIQTLTLFATSLKRHSCNEIFAAQIGDRSFGGLEGLQWRMRQGVTGCFSDEEGPPFFH